MNIIELKEQIISGELNDDLLVLVGGDQFTVRQYINEIKDLKKLPINEISSLAETTEMSALALIMGYEDKLNILRVDTFNEDYDSYFNFKNIIVVCDKIDKKLEKNSDLSNYIVKFPTLLDWQIKDYMSVICPELNEKAIEWLYAVTNGSIDRIVNEIDKLLLFDPEERMDMLRKMSSDPETDLIVPVVKNSFEIFDAIILKDHVKVGNVLKHRGIYDMTTYYMLTTIMNTFKLIALVRSGITGKALGDLERQAWKAEKGNMKYLKIDRCQKAFEVLASIDRKIKNGEFDMPEEQQVDYIITHLFAI